MLAMVTQDEHVENPEEYLQSHLKSMNWLQPLELLQGRNHLVFHLTNGALSVKLEADSLRESAMKMFFEKGNLFDNEWLALQRDRIQPDHMGFDLGLRSPIDYVLDYEHLPIKNIRLMMEHLLSQPDVVIHKQILMSAFDRLFNAGVFNDYLARAI